MAVLEETNVEKRLALALELIKKELQMSKMQRDISKKVEDKIKKAHHEHMLREQLKGMVLCIFRSLNSDGSKRDTFESKTWESRVGTHLG